LAFGSWLRRNRRRRDAREQLQAAQAIFETLGVSPWMERAQAGIRASGGTSHRRDTLVFDQLTPQEVQVARLITEGMTNRDAATHLYLSPRTIEFHLRNIYTKLGITSRTELARLEYEGKLA
jgi:DNA-binding NarL/FixJ family response regulator